MAASGEGRRLPIDEAGQWAKRPGHVVSTGARHEIEQIARVAGGVAAHLHPEHGVTEEGLDRKSVV